MSDDLTDDELTDNLNYDLPVSTLCAGRLDRAKCQGIVSDPPLLRHPIPVIKKRFHQKKKWSERPAGAEQKQAVGTGM